MNDEKKRPVHKERAGNGVAVALFENAGKVDGRRYHTAQLTKSYRGTDGTLHESRMTLRIADLLLVEAAARRAFDWAASNHPADSGTPEESDGETVPEDSLV